jgi:hypothetical protein
MVIHKARKTSRKKISNPQLVDRNIRIQSMIERIIEILPTNSYEISQPRNYTYGFDVYKEQA